MPPERQKSLGLRAVAMMSRRRMDSGRQADRIDDTVQLGRQPAARATDGGSFSPFCARRIRVDFRDGAVDQDVLEVRRRRRSTT